MSKVIKFNPVSRISGALKVEVTIDKHTVIDAKCCYKRHRNFEELLKGRLPIDSICFNENVYGICSTVNSLAASMALENAYEVIPDSNDSIIRDIIHGFEFIKNHIKQFYLFCVPDFVRLSNNHQIINSSFSDLRLPYTLDKEVNNHYFKSIKYIRIANEALNLLDEKVSQENKIIIGGTTCQIDSHKIINLKSLISSIKGFLETNMTEDLSILTYYYKDYYFKGISTGNFMSFGIFNNDLYDNFTYVKPKVLVNGILENFHTELITEDTYNSWYSENRKIPFPSNKFIDTNLIKPKAYTFIMAPRYNGNSMEVGPLARMILSGNYKSANSCMDRICARVLEAKLIVNLINHLCDLLGEKSSNLCSYVEKSQCSGTSYLDTAVGSLSHYINIENSKITNYNILAPCCWNFSPKDMNNIPGALETALLGTYIDNVSNPIELVRIIKSFDCCVSCTLHVLNDCNIPIEINII